MRTPTEHIKTLQRRVDFLKTRAHKNSYDAAEIGSLEWAIVNLSPQRTWVGLTDKEAHELWESTDSDDDWELMKRTEAKLKEKNT